MRFAGCETAANECLGTTSVTRLGKFSPRGQKFTSLWQIFDGLFLFWQNDETTLAICDIVGQIFITENGQILKKQSGQSGHTGWLPHRRRNFDGALKLVSISRR